MKTYVTIDQVLKKLPMHRQQLWRLRKAGKFVPEIRPGGGKVLFALEDIREWEKANMANPRRHHAGTKSQKTKGYNTIRQIREICALLEREFDTGSGRYRNGQNDLAIAKKTGAPVEFVAEVREDAFERTKEPEEVAAIRQELETVKTMVAELTSKMELVARKYG
jgi:predicted DNA-binding transcriptional regulator AlpA